MRCYTFRLTQCSTGNGGGEIPTQLWLGTNGVVKCRSFTVGGSTLACRVDFDGGVMKGDGNGNVGSFLGKSASPETATGTSTASPISILMEVARWKSKQTARRRWAMHTDSSVLPPREMRFSPVPTGAEAGENDALFRLEYSVPEGIEVVVRQ